MNDTVRVDIKRNLDLRHAARRSRDPIQMEAPERLVICRHLALALQNMNLNRGLIIRRGREDLALLRRDRGVALNQTS